MRKTSKTNSSLQSAESFPPIRVTFDRTGKSKNCCELGMREMQARAYKSRKEQYLLIKSPPASGKSRALMYIALDKIHNQNLKQAIIVVPERSIGASFFNAPLKDSGFWENWIVKPKWDLCSVPAIDNIRVAKSKVETVREFLKSDDSAMVCTHSTFRYAVEKFGIDIFDDRLIAIDEFHHLSIDKENVLGNQFRMFMNRNKVHIVAMTGSFFRGDSIPVILPEDEARFKSIKYTYYEQLNGYEYLKNLEIGYKFYSGSYLNSIDKALDSNLKTIVHIPKVNSRESTQRGKSVEVSQIMGKLGKWLGKDKTTGFDLIARKDGRILKVADLVDDGPDRHPKVLASLRNTEIKSIRDHVDIIIALGMAKEGFDWLWCEHALTVGYRSSLTEIVQIIGRATRDAPGKETVQFTNLIAEPDATSEKVAEAVNDTLKAIAASLLMEQVLVIKLSFAPAGAGEDENFHYGDEGYQPDEPNVGYDDESGEIRIEINGLVQTISDEATRIIKEDLTEVKIAVIQNTEVLEKAIFDEDIPAQEITQVYIGKVIRKLYPHLSEQDIEAIRQRIVATFNLTQIVRQESANAKSTTDNQDKLNTRFIDSIRKIALDVRELDVDLIDKIRPFGDHYEIISKTMDESVLRQFSSVVSQKRVKMDEEEARILAIRAKQFLVQHRRLPDLAASDPFERRMAEAIEYLKRKVREEAYD